MPFPTYPSHPSSLTPPFPASSPRLTTTPPQPMSPTFCTPGVVSTLPQAMICALPNPFQASRQSTVFASRARTTWCYSKCSLLTCTLYARKAPAAAAACSPSFAAPLPRLAASLAPTNNKCRAKEYGAKISCLPTIPRVFSALTAVGAAYVLPCNDDQSFLGLNQFVGRVSWWVSRVEEAYRHRAGSWVGACGEVKRDAGFTLYDNL